MVRDETCRKDADLGPVADMSARLHGRTVIASSRGLRSHHGTIDIASTLALMFTRGHLLTF